MAGVISRGVQGPIIREGDDIVDIVVKSVYASEAEDNYSLKNRDIYLRQLKAFQGTEMIKVITGIRRCGKSCLMKLMVEHLRGSGIGDKQIVEMNFESMRFAVMTAKDLYRYVSERVIPGKRMYLFFDEVQRLDDWENAVNSFRVDFDCDIYITGSNAHLLSTELSTYLSGQYVEIKVLLKAALTDEINSREVYLSGIDQSYYYESLSAFRAGDL